MLTHNGTSGRSYGGDPELIHIPDHHRGDVGKMVAQSVDEIMRLIHTLEQGREGYASTPTASTLCPGCYMIALFDGLVELAKRTGQPVSELAHTMSNAFAKLAADGEYRMTEEIEVQP